MDKTKRKKGREERNGILEFSKNYVTAGTVCGKKSIRWGFFSLIVIVLVASGIGANTAVFSLS